MPKPGFEKFGLVAGIAMTGAEAAISQLVAEGTRVFLGIPGEHTACLCNAVLNHPETRFITGRHEQGIAFMANGYARAGGGIAVPIAISGPGVANCLTPMADAYLDSVPMVLIAGQSDPARLGKGAFHELKDQSGALASIVKWNTRVAGVADVPDAIRTAFSQAHSGRPGPTAVEIPLNVQTERGEADIFPSDRPERRKAETQAVQKAARLPRSAKSPLVYVGRGAAISGCSDELIELMERLSIPCFTTALAKGVVPDAHPLNASWGGARHGLVRELMREADLVFVVGSSLDEADGERIGLDFSKKLVQIDTSEQIIGRRYEVTVELLGDARAVLRQLTSELSRMKPRTGGRVAARIAAHKNREKRSLSSKMAFRYIAALQEALPEDAMVTNDASWANGWALSFLERSRANTFTITRMAAALGFAFPAAVGAKMAHPRRQAAALVGDGGFLFTSFSLATAVQHGLNAVAVVFNDSSYSTIKRVQLSTYGQAIGVDLRNPDFVAMAEAFGASGVRASSPDQLYEALLSAWQRNVPTVIDVPLPQDLDYLT